MPPLKRSFRVRSVSCATAQCAVRTLRTKKSPFSATISCPQAAHHLGAAKTVRRRDGRVLCLPSVSFLANPPASLHSAPSLAQGGQVPLLFLTRSGEPKCPAFCFKSQMQAKSQFCAVCPYLLLTQLGGGCECGRTIMVSP